jgi:hypothetical protein
MPLSMASLLSTTVLFEHLDASISLLQRKKVHWKRSMLTALQAAREKLKDYYGKTTGDHSNLYAMGTVLHTAGMVR